jgi:hypothetical protein
MHCQGIIYIGTFYMGLSTAERQNKEKFLKKQQIIFYKCYEKLVILTLNCVTAIFGL